MLPNEMGYSSASELGFIAVITADGRLQVLNLDEGKTLPCFCGLRKNADFLLQFALFRHSSSSIYA